MFEQKNPPFLVIPVASERAYAFPETAGYNHHRMTQEKTLISYGDGWIFPVPAKKKEFITESPLMLLRNIGGVTAESSTSRSGYAHQFVGNDGKEPEYVYKQSLFKDDTGEDWMLIADTVDVIWLQFSIKYQFLGDAGTDAIEYQYGKLIIMNMVIVKDIAPSLNRKADIPELHDIQYRVSDRQVLGSDWSMADTNTRQYLSNLLVDRGLDRYREAVDYALLRAGFPEGTGDR